MTSTRGWILAMATAVALAACGDSNKVSSDARGTDGTTYDPVARGEYIVNNVAYC